MVCEKYTLSFGFLLVYAQWHKRMPNFVKCVIVAKVNYNTKAEQ